MAGTKYANPPIEEATCQFTLSESAEWNKSTPGRLFESLKDRYPGLPSQEQLLQANLTPGAGIASPELALTQNERVVFIDSKNEARLSVGPRIVSLHRGRPYIGFEEELLPRVRKDLPAVLAVLDHAPAFSAVSTRYVNKIVIPEKNFDLADYFAYWGASSALPEPFEGDIAGFFYRIGGNRASRPEILSLTFGSIDSPKDSAAFILDIDLVHNFDEPVNTDDAIAQLIELKGLENQIFESLLKDKTRELFR
jgi:uncharacterized protein (TIGR04255 family)